MAGTILQGEAFEKAQDKAREERLRRAIEHEMAAHRSLCQHYNAAIEQIAELEDTENGRAAKLENDLARVTQENLKLRKSLELAKFKQIFLSLVILSCLLVIFLFSMGLI